MNRTIVVAVQEDMENEFPLIQSLKGAGMHLVGIDDQGQCLLVAQYKGPEVAQAILGFCWCHPSVKCIQIQPVPANVQETANDDSQADL